jgi:hypothetical protein
MATTTAEDKGKKPDKKPKPTNKSNKVQIKVTNAVVGTSYTANLVGQTQTKVADETDLTFNIHFKKGNDTVPKVGDTITGNINGTITFSVTIKDKNKPNKITVTLP